MIQRKGKYFILLVCYLCLTFIFFNYRKKVVIHVPYRIKKIKHTHTVYKIIPHLEHERADDSVGDNEEFDHFK